MKNFLNSILIFSAIIGVIIIGTSVLYNTISDLNNTLEDNRKTENTLKSKLSLLQSVGKEATADSQGATNALPATSPILYLMSNIRNSAQISGLAINSFTFSEIVNTGGSNLHSGEVIFETEGGYAGIVSFINTIKNSAPLTRFDEIKILTQNRPDASDYKFTADLFTYWSPFPTTIPAVDEPSTQLTTDELQILSKITTLSAPVIIAGPSSATITPGRIDPFSL